MQSGELAGIAVGATVILNVLLAGYVRLSQAMHFQKDYISNFSYNLWQLRSRCKYISVSMTAEMVRFGFQVDGAGFEMQDHIWSFNESDAKLGSCHSGQQV